MSKTAIEDAITFFASPGEIQLFQETHLDVLNHLRPDIVVFRRNGMIIGACEVKKPSKEGGDLENEKLDIQISNYLLRLKYSHGLQAAFGITSTYNEFRFYWLPEANSIATATEVSREVDILPDGYYEGEQVIYRSKVYQRTDPNLIEALVSVVQKMNMSPVDPHSSFLSDTRNPLTRKFGVMVIQADNEAEPVGFIWNSIPRSVTRLLLTLPGDQSKQLYLLQDYHGGADGRVWLSMNEKGCICVLKFSHSRMEDELTVWKNVWNCERARVVNLLANTPALIMPFAFHSIISNGKIFFHPFGQWVHIEQMTEEPSKEASKETAQRLADSFPWVKWDIDKITEYVSDPWIAAKEALVSLAENRYRHLDIAWRHVALLPQENDTMWTVRPILIDVHRIQHFGASPTEDWVEKEVQSGLKLLQKEISDSLR